jgi:drug/metabolite transporter (DMT)-like permease
MAVLGAALLHATWNAIVKLGVSKLTTMFIMTFVQGSLGLIIALSRDFPVPEIWPWLLASGVLHAAYKLFLAFAYEQGDLSRVYPIARGAAPMLVMVVSIVWLCEVMSAMEYLGIFILGCGILAMAQGVFSSGESRKLVPLALASALMTAGYSIVDGLGARLSGDTVTFVAWMFALDLMFFAPVAMFLRGTRTLIAPPKAWVMGGIAALASYGAYAIAVWAMTIAPIALVTAIRETSILFAILIGWLFFGEAMGKQKVVAAALIVCGVILTRI